MALAPVARIAGPPDGDRNRDRKPDQSTDQVDDQRQMRIVDAGCRAHGRELEEAHADADKDRRQDEPLMHPVMLDVFGKVQGAEQIHRGGPSGQGPDEVEHIAVNKLIHRNLSSH